MLILFSRPFLSAHKNSKRWDVASFIEKFSKRRQIGDEIAGSLLCGLKLEGYANQRTVGGLYV